MATMSTPVRNHPVWKQLDGARVSRTPLILGHRGCAALEVENSLSAFVRAAELNIAGVELDVQLSSDGAVVVAHDGDTARVAPDAPSHRVAALPAAELAALPLRVMRDGQTLTARGIPTLTAVVDALPAHYIIDIELKSYRDTSPLLARAVAEFIAHRSIAHRVLVSSFDPRLLLQFRRAARTLALTVPTAAIWSRDPEVPVVLRGGAGMWLTGSTVAKPSWNEFLRRAGGSSHAGANPSADASPGAAANPSASPGTSAGAIKLRFTLPHVVWTVNDTSVAAALAEAGIAGIISDTCLLSTTVDLASP